MNLRFWSDPNKEPERYYLLAGMGGSAARRKHRRILIWSLIAGLTVSVALAALMILLNGSAK